MPALAEQVIPAPERRSPPAIQFPLFPTNPCLWYPSGERQANEGRPCIMKERENHEFITLLEFRCGENYEHKAVRHVDDPHLAANPRIRRAGLETHASGGAWDYAQGHVYGFELPAGVRHLFGPPRAPLSQPLYQPPAWPFDSETESKIVVLASQGRTPAEIASNLALPGVKAAVISKYLEAASLR